MGPRGRQAEQSSARHVRARLSSAFLHAHSWPERYSCMIRSSRSLFPGSLQIRYQSNSCWKELDVFFACESNQVLLYRHCLPSSGEARELSLPCTHAMLATIPLRSCRTRCGRGRAGRGGTGGGGGESPLESDRESEMRQDELLKHSVRCVDTLHVDVRMSARRPPTARIGFHLRVVELALGGEKGARPSTNPAT